MEPLQKHARYGSSYKPGDTFWGIGIENETYIQFADGIVKPAKALFENRKRERYSVDYWSTYKSTVVDDVIKRWIVSLPDGGKTTVKFPLLMNAHSLQNVDICGEHKTTYTKTPAPNPKYRGKSLLEELSAIDPKTFIEGKDRWWTIDGDTIEFMTQNYYCAKIEDVIAEFKEYKARFLAALRDGLEKLPDRESLLKQVVNYPHRNHGFAVYATNRHNIGVFNNGTYHVNITLPTCLDKEAKIADYKLFEIQHRNAARLFQWVSPFLIAKYGSGDVFSDFCRKDSRFPAGSQRLAASRYISAGMYDTVTMPRGKLLTALYTRVPGRWYEKLYDISGFAYKSLPSLGLDINYNKHWNHGLEFRIFDWFPEDLLPELLRILIWMCDTALSRDVPDPRPDSTYNELLALAIYKGATAYLTPVMATIFGKILQVPLTNTNIVDAYKLIYETWCDRWNHSSNSCTSRMIKYPLLRPKSERKREAEVTVVRSTGLSCC